jgi:hypothetical protein
MGLGEAIDITFDFRSDTPPGKIRTLAVQHSGGIISSSGASRCRVVRHSSSTSPPRTPICTTSPELGEFFLSSHGDVGALEEIDRAFGSNVTPLRRVAG